MGAYGLLIDYEFCTGCQSCEVACKEEHRIPVGQWGIHLLDDGPWECSDGKFNWNKIPVPTRLCDLCAERTAKGKQPSCVHHCLAGVMQYGPVEELARELAEKPGAVRPEALPVLGLARSLRKAAGHGLGRPPSCRPAKAARQTRRRVRCGKKTTRPPKR